METALIQLVLGRYTDQFLTGPQKGPSNNEVIVMGMQKYLSQIISIEYYSWTWDMDVFVQHPTQLVGQLVLALTTAPCLQGRLKTESHIQQSVLLSIRLPVVHRLN